MNDTENKQPMAYSDWWDQIMIWVRQKDFKKVKLSAQKRLEYMRTKV